MSVPPDDKPVPLVRPVKDRRGIAPIAVALGIVVFVVAGVVKPWSAIPLPGATSSAAVVAPRPLPSSRAASRQTMGGTFVTQQRAYLTLANEVLRLHQGAREDHPMDADAHGHAVASAVAYQRALDGLNALTVPMSVERDLSQLQSATQSVMRAFLAAADATSEDDARARVLLASYGALPEMQAEADDVRRGLGLPPRAEGDPL